jgi:hypothetical protein
LYEAGETSFGKNVQEYCDRFLLSLTGALRREIISISKGYISFEDFPDLKILPGF